MNFAERRKQAEDAGLLGSGDYFKVKEGDNRFRLMSECLPHTDEYQGKKNFKWLCYVIDRRDGKVKPYFMPHKIYKAIEALQINPDYEFADVPMPYDITVTAKNAGTKEVEYGLIPARKETPITAVEHQAFAEQKSLVELQRMLLEKKAKNGSGNPPPHGDDEHSAPLDGDEIPFAWLLPLIVPTLLAFHLFA